METGLYKIMLLRLGYTYINKNVLVLLAEVGTCYFFRSPLPLVRNFQKIGSPLALVRYSAIASFYVVQSRCFATAIFTVVHCY